MVIQLIGIRQLSVRRWKNGWSPSRKAALQTQMEVRRQQIDRTSPLLAHSPDESHIAKSLLSSSQVALDNSRSRGEAAVAPPKSGCVFLADSRLSPTCVCGCEMRAFCHLS